MQRFWSTLFSGRLRNVLMVSFSMIAAITIGTGTIATSRTITDYLARAADQRIARDMDLALAFYHTRQERIERIAQRLANAHSLYVSVGDQGNCARAIELIDAAVENEIHAQSPIRNQLIMILDREGNVLSGQLVTEDTASSIEPHATNWASLPIVATAMAEGKTLVATEVVPAEYLAPVGLAEQAQVTIVDTPKAAPEPYDPREGTAGLALLAAAPVHGKDAQLVGVVVSMHLFNNDFSLVDQVKQVAGVDTATIFFGDLRVSTNVLNEQGARAIGTRISQEVGDQVLLQGLEYPGRAYVVKEWFITRYVPLHNYRGDVVGSLYVGARESTFQALVQTFVARIIYIALATVGLAAALALPVSIAITRPIAELVKAHRGLASGKMGVRVVPAKGKGELATLAQSFNVMAQTLQVTQEQLVQKEKLASVGQLAAGVAHEINNPLGTIMLLSDVLYKEAPADDPRREDLKMITDQAKRCKGIVFDLLSFARQNRVMAQRTDVNQLVRRVVAEESPKDRYDKIEIVQDLAPRLPIIQADPEQLRQALVNLMTNAADAMAPEGGGMTISTRHAGVQHIELAVADTGTGMSEEVRSQLFTPFFTTKPPGQGTGLGLSIIYGIVKMHRGDIQVWSEAGKGSRFTIRLPTRLPDLNLSNTLQELE
ncbi:MAG TPA: cache domain-containing protein [Anaerolineae bacterium]|nr:cache domain-containing protein [Anaerolineae bacterium]